MFPLVLIPRKFDDPVFQGDHVRFHTERDIRLNPHSRLPLHDNENVDDLLVIEICYEAHLCMQQMLVACAQMRGDDALEP